MALMPLMLNGVSGTVTGIRVDTPIDRSVSSVRAALRFASAFVSSSNDD